MKCKKLIWHFLGLLDHESKTVQEFLNIDKVCVQSLINLDKSCCNDLIAVARDLLKCASDEQKEYKFQAVLRAIISRQQAEAFELIFEALESKNATDKETYLNFLCELGDSRTVSELLKFLERYEAVHNDLPKDESFISLINESITQIS